MAFCSSCGTQVDDGVKFCPSCGKAVGTQTGSENTSKINDTIQNINNTADYSNEFDSQDVENNKIISLFSYIGFLFLIPLLASSNSKYARFHVNQGLVLFLADVAYGIVAGILGILGVFIPFFWIITTLYNICGLAFAALIILGIYNAVTGKAKELPVIGKIRIIK